MYAHDHMHIARSPFSGFKPCGGYQSAVAKARAYQIAGDENDTLRKERARLAANS